MTEQQTPVLDPGTQSAPAAPAPAKKKHKKKKAGKILVAAAVLAALAVGGFLMWKFVLSDPEEEQGEVLTQAVGNVDFRQRQAIDDLPHALRSA